MLSRVSCAKAEDRAWQVRLRAYCAVECLIQCWHLPKVLTATKAFYWSCIARYSWWGWHGCPSVIVMHGCICGGRLALTHAAFVQFEASLKRELESAQQGRSNFITKFSEKDYEAIVGGWQDKLVRVAEGTQKWGLFTAVKPAV